MMRDMQTVLAAIDGSGGIMNAVADRLGVAWHTADKLVAHWETTRTAIDDERAGLLDKAERVVTRAIDEGDLQTAKWYLTQMGRRRGYGDAIKVGFDDDAGGLILIRPAGGRDERED